MCNRNELTRHDGDLRLDTAKPAAFVEHAPREPDLVTGELPLTSTPQTTITSISWPAQIPGHGARLA